MVLLVAFFSRLPFVMTFAFFSDESVYTYAAYAISRGAVPYKDIVLAHPPVGFLVMSPIVLLSGGNLTIVRLFYLVLLIIIGALSYVLFDQLRQHAVSRVNPVVASSIFTLYPVPFSLTTPIQFSVFDPLIIGALILFVRGVVKRSCPYFLLSGLLVGFAVMDWYPAVFVELGLISFLFLFEHKVSTWKNLIEFSIFSLAGLVVSVSSILIGIILTGGLHNFLLQTVMLQSSIRNGISLGVRLEHVWSAVQAYLPLVLLAISGGVQLIILSRRPGLNKTSLLPIWLLVTNLALITTVPKVLFLHYLAYLTPFMAYSGSIPVQKLLLAFSIGRQRSVRLSRSPTDFYQVLVAIAIIAMLVLIPVYLLPFNTSLVSNNAYTLAEYSVGSYVAGITGPNDRIWTSEAGIGYFATRLIQPPSSTSWPLQGTYNDVFNATFVDLDGVVQQGFGIVTPQEFQSSWQANKTKVLVFIVGNGPIPYPDPLLWDGFNGISGVHSWVEANYHLVTTIVFPDVTYVYNVWVRN